MVNVHNLSQMRRSRHAGGFVYPQQSLERTPSGCRKRAGEQCGALPCSRPAVFEAAAAMLDSKRSDAALGGAGIMSLLGGLLGPGWRAAPQGTAASGQSASAPGPDGPSPVPVPVASPDAAGSPLGGSGWPRDIGPSGTSPAVAGNSFVPPGAGSRAAGTPTDARGSRHEFGASPPPQDDAARDYALAARAHDRSSRPIGAQEDRSPPETEARSVQAEAPGETRTEAGPSGYADHLGPLRGQGPANGKVLDRAA